MSTISEGTPRTGFDDTGAPRLHGRLYWAIADGLVLAKRNLLRVPRIPELLVFSIIQPVMFVLLFRYVLGAGIDVGGDTSYVDFLMAGIFVYTVAFASVSTGVGVAMDLQKGLIDRFRSLPMSRSAVLTGRTVADLARNTLTVAVMLAVGLLVGFRPEAGAANWAAAVGLLLLLSFAFSWVGTAVGLLVRSVEGSQSAGFIWLFPLTFASSAFVPTEGMVGPLRAFANNQPITQVIDAVRGFLIDRPVGSAGWLAFAWCLGILAVFMPLSVSLYKRTTAR